MTRLLPWLRLMRLPALFTAMADIVLGFLMTHDQLNLQTRSAFLVALLASSLLYLSGMVWNDIFDFEIDKKDRPERPLPSGAISIPAARRFGVLLMAGGIVASFFLSPLSVVIAFFLTGSILAYDMGGKKTPAGPILMGGCRSLNLLLGASAGLDDYQILASTPALFGIAGGLGIYIAGVTWFARSEAKPESKHSLWGGVITIIAGAAILGVTIFLHTKIVPTLKPVIVLEIIILIVILRAIHAIRSMHAQHIQLAVKRMLFSYVMLDAILVYACTSSPEYAVATAALLFPTMLLSRIFAVT